MAAPLRGRDLKPFHILITGGAGFIASHIADAFIERGYRVTVLDNLSTGARRNLNPEADFLEGDLRDDAVCQSVAKLSLDFVCHHAAQIDLRRSLREPSVDADVNVVGSLKLFEAASRAGARKIIFASTGGALYGEPQFAPQSEEHPTRPLSPYGCAKLAIEHYLEYYREVRGIEAVALRYANVYGARQSDQGDAGVVSIFGRRLLRGEDLLIFGSGEQTRDFVHVSDVVRANVAAIEHPRASGSFNVGTGIETSVNELADLMKGLVDSSSRIEHRPAITGEQKRSVLDGSRFRRLASLPEPVRLAEVLPAVIESFRLTTR